ncbi:MAG: O-methyltransferase [Lachnospiraceae bacterium]|nr:O-methyltransferase [Lachnospiraceae bacterium]
MMEQERLAIYINSLEQEDSPLVSEIAREAVASRVPVMRRETASLIKTLLTMKQPRHILEVGTAVGYSALVMAENTAADCHITTIEKYGKRIPVARENFRRAGMEDRITLLEGDGLELVGRLPGPFDFIFMDAAKAQYIRFLPDMLRLLPPGGVMVSDNVLQEGDILESRFAVRRRDRTIHSRMREYLYAIKHHEALSTAILPVGDGVAVSVRRPQEE